MVLKEQTLKKLKSVFDLNIYEVKIWTALLSKGVASAGELSEISNVPRSRSYDVLESLEKKGFIVMKIGKPIKYIAVKPEEIINRVKFNIKAKSEERIENMDSVVGTNIFSELELLYKNGIDNVDPSALSGALKGRSNIYSKIIEMVKGAKKSVKIMTTDEGLMRKYNYLKNHVKKLDKVDIRILAPLSNDHNKILEDLKGYVKIKDYQDAKGRLIIVDGKEALFMVSDDKDIHENYDSAVWVQTPFLANALSSMFDLAWK
jgi:HTH-type transcriptional regulator, sugar sensing transcriptional regulator